MTNPQVYVIRAGRHGEREAAALEANVATIGFDDIGNLTQFDTRDDVKAHFAERYPDKSSVALGNWAGQVWRFSREIHMGRVSGPYHYFDDPKMLDCLSV